MNTRKVSTSVMGVLAVALVPAWSSAADNAPAEDRRPPAAAPADRPAGRAAPAPAPVDRAEVDRLVAALPERPRLGARQMIAKYGPPQEATSERLVWHNQGPFKRILLTRTEIPHDFPKPHVDYLEHTIEYRVPQGKADMLLDFDGSVTVDRTAGELSAKCDLEAHNVLTLNLAHDIVTGKKDVKEARRAFGENVVLESLGKKPPYVTALQFEPAKVVADFPDRPVIPGSPMRAPPGEPELASDRGMTEAEALAFIIAVDDNEILAASEAEKKKISPEVMSYSKMLHEEHGKNLAQTMKLGQQIEVTPLETDAVEKLRIKGAGQLAALVPLEGEQFEKGYLDAMVKGHTETLRMIDDQLLEAAKNEELKKHLTETRESVAKHLQQAKTLQAGTKAPE